MSSRNPQVFVTKLPRDVTQDDLKKSFKKYGHIKEITLKRGFGFVVSIVFLYFYKPMTDF